MTARVRMPFPAVLPILLIAVLEACSLGGGVRTIVLEPGPGTLSNPVAGLTGLAGYHAVLTQDVTGTLDGAPFERHTRLELTRLNDQVDYIQAIQGSQENTYFHLFQSPQAIYRWSAADGTCQGEAGTHREGEVIEPASLLLTVIASTPVGSETINGIPSDHYTFDQSGLALTDPKPAVSGEIWLAQQGGYVVRYLLNAAPPAAPSDQGFQTGLSMTYELSPVDTLALPTTCMAVPLDLPIMPDAVNVSRASGTLAYQTASNPAQVVELYFGQLGALGWQALSQKPEGEVKLPLGLAFSQGPLVLAINLDEYEAGSLDVGVVIFNPSLPRQLPQAAATPSISPTPSGPVPTVNPATSGLPADVPLYPGATNLQQFNTAYLFDAPDAPAVVSTYYKEQMARQGWNLLQEMNENGQVVQIWEKESRMATMQVSLEEGVTKVMLSLVNP